MSAHAIVIGQRCNWCSRQLSPARVRQLANYPGNPRICDYCELGHLEATEVLAGRGVPRFCQECGITRETLAELTPGLAIRMFVVPKDGILQVLCPPCKEAYVRKRADLYRNTEYGKAEKI